MKILQKLLLFFTVLATPASAWACPFCSATSQTLSEELAASDVAVIAELIESAPEFSHEENAPPGADTGLATFAVQKVIRGDRTFATGEQIKVVYFGSDEEQKRFLIQGMDATGTAESGKEKQVDWTTPMPLSSRAVEYVEQLLALPEKGPDRLTFFMQHFEDKDPLLAQDAYDEFARAPYEEIIALGDRLDRVQLMAWIDDPEVGPTRRRLYLTLLGICGKAEDAEKLESLLLYDYQRMKPGIEMLVAVMGQYAPPIAAPLVDELMRADARRKQQCLDALIAAYLKLKGPTGLPLIEERYLANPDAEYTQVYATVMALRFHGEETDVIPRQRLLEAMRLLLDNEEAADQVITDLTRWEDWSVMDRLVELFKTSEEDAWIRQPVISYLLVAGEQPGEVGSRADKALEELEAIDPQTVKRARSYAAFGILTRPGGADSAVQPGTKATEPPNEKSLETSAANPTETAESVAPKPSANATPVAQEQTPNAWTIIGVPLAAVLILMAIFALLLRGADVRSHEEGA